MLLLIQAEALARKPEASWKNHCAQCHGDHAEFARKYLWNIGGRLQGRHHIDDLPLFLKNHYIPAHEIEAISNMLLAQANSPARFDAECGGCHGDAARFVEQSIWVRGDSMTAMKAGMEVSEFLTSHQGIEAEGVEFYLKLFARVAE